MQLTAPSTALSFTEAVTPWIPVMVILLGSVAAGIFGIWNRRRGNIENRAPDVNELWNRQAVQDKQLDLERMLRRSLEDFGGMLRRSFRGYVERVQAGGSSVLTEYERRAYDNPLPRLDEHGELHHSPDGECDTR